MITTLKGRVRKGLIVPNVTLEIPDGSEVTVHLEQSPEPSIAESATADGQSARLKAFLDAIEQDQLIADTPALPIKNTKRESIYGGWTSDV